MIIDCDAALVNTRCADRVRYSRAKVGVATDRANNPVLVVITSSVKEKFRIVNNCTIRSSTISFETPKRDLFLKNCDEVQRKMIFALITKILKGQLIPKLPNVAVMEKLRPKPTSLVIQDNSYSATDLSNKCLQKLHCEKLRLVPRLVWKLTNLHELKLVNCQLTEIPTKLTDLAPKLRTLDLSWNQIKAIDSWFATAMRHLTSLDLSHNQLEFVPYQIKAMTSLERINLSHNQLTDVTNTLGLILSLRCLDLSHNNLNFLPYTLIKNLTIKARLNNLDLASNPLREKSEKPSDHVKRSFPSLLNLSASAIMSSDKLLFVCHEYLPPSLYNIIAINGENCLICSRGLVDRQMKLRIIHMSLEQIAVCLSTSHFPTFPLVPAMQYICHFCRATDKLQVKYD